MTEESKTTAATTNVPNSSTAPSLSPPSIYMVVQRYRRASLLINEDYYVHVGSKDEPSNNSTCGMVVYISFAKGADHTMVETAAKMVLNLPIMTLGVWGDGVSSKNIIQLAKSQPKSASLVIVPQANLICKPKSQGKSLQYHGQIDKEDGHALYKHFVNCIRSSIFEHQCNFQGKELPGWYQALKKTSPKKMDPSIPPQEFFKDLSLYSSWDDEGMPLTDAKGEGLTKSAQKKLRKALAAQKTRYEKYLTKSPAETVKVVEQKEPDWSNALDSDFCHFVSGTFGKLQAFEMVSDMGPFCHAIQL